MPITNDDKNGNIALGGSVKIDGQLLKIIGREKTAPESPII